MVVGRRVALLCSSSAAPDIKSGTGEESGALWVQQGSLALFIFGPVSLPTDLQWSAITLFPVSAQDMAAL